MSHHPHTRRVASSTEAAPAPLPVEHVSYEPPALDPHGFDPAEYRWVPVKRMPRADGWSNEKQRAFIENLADLGSVAQAARLVGMSEQSAYKLRRAPGAEGFARAWDSAVVEGGKRLLDVAMERATLGAEEPVFDRDGQVIAIKRKPSDRLLMFLLRTRLGDRFGLLGGADGGREADAATPALPSVAKAMVALEPAQVDAPHLTMTAQALTDACEIADMGDGALPHWLSDMPPPPRHVELNGLPRAERAPASSRPGAATGAPGNRTLG